MILVVFARVIPSETHSEHQYYNREYRRHTAAVHGEKNRKKKIFQNYHYARMYVARARTSYTSPRTRAATMSRVNTAYRGTSYTYGVCIRAEHVLHKVVLFRFIVYRRSSATVTARRVRYYTYSSFLTRFTTLLFFAPIFQHVCTVYTY